MPRLLLTSFVALLIACGGTETTAADPLSDGDGTADASSPAPTGDSADWRAYPAAPGEEWPTRPLDDERWVRAAGDLGCIGRAHHGDPSAHREAMQRVLAHHATTAEAVMAYGIAVNSDERAGTLGARVADSVETCK